MPPSPDLLLPTELMQRAHCGRKVLPAISELQHGLQVSPEEDSAHLLLHTWPHPTHDSLQQEHLPARTLHIQTGTRELTEISCYSMQGLKCLPDQIYHGRF